MAVFAAASALACVGLGAGQARAEAPSCAATAERHVVVDQDIGPVTVATDFDLTAIAAMATRLGASFARPPEGFYLGKFAATVTVDPAEAPETCDAPIAIHVTLHLTGRVIEIGRDLLSQPCRQAAAIEHYQLHASADEAVIARTAASLKNHLTTAPIVTTDLDAWLRTLIAGDTKLLDEERRAAQNAVNTPAALARLDGACSV
jgi:hypothetical protein